MYDLKQGKMVKPRYNQHRETGGGELTHGGPWGRRRMDRLYVYVDWPMMGRKETKNKKTRWRVLDKIETAAGQASHEAQSYLEVPSLLLVDTTLLH